MLKQGVAMLRKLFGLCLLIILFTNACGQVSVDYNNTSNAPLSQMSICELPPYDKPAIGVDLNGSICEFNLCPVSDVSDSMFSYFIYITNFQNDFTYELMTKIFEENDIRIVYPIIKMEDTELQIKINNLLMDRVYELISWTFDLDESIGLEIYYEVKASSDRLISIVFRGIGFVQGTARPFHLFQTLNINITTGNEIMLNEIINIDEQLINLMLSEQATYLNPNPELIALISEIIAEEHFLCWFQEVGNAVFYFTDNNLGISISGLGGAAGDHAEIEISYDAFAK